MELKEIKKEFEKPIKEEYLYIGKFVYSFLDLYIKGYMTRENETHDRKPMLEMLINSRVFVHLSPQQIEEEALTAYLEKAVLGLYMKLNKNIYTE